MNQAAREGNNINNYAEEPNSIDIHHRNKLIILVPDVSREILNLRRT
jgi:alpha-D-ribose 1-methylphosphonate 5-triphosphate synthase subunit PhnL